MRNETGQQEIHPAPGEFSEAQLAADPILRFFHYKHLPPMLRRVSNQFCQTARFVVEKLPRNAERTVALRKLLEAKDAAVRANLPAPGETFDHITTRMASELTVGELVDFGGHSEDRDGPVPFDG